MARKLSRREHEAVITGATGDRHCSIPMATGSPCYARPKWIATRVDGSTFVLCTRHYQLLDALHARRPEVYEPISVRSL